MPTSFSAREDILRNFLTKEDRTKLEQIAEKGGFISAELITSVLFEMDCLRMSLCEIQGELQSQLTGKYCGPASVADTRGWEYLYPR